jgi:hypothetical protein
MNSVLRLLCVLMAALTTLQPGAMAHDSPLLRSWDGFSFKIEDSQCRVGIAAVKLSVSELSAQAGNLVASYAIEVPLSQASNDSGLIVLPITLSVDQLGTEGGTLTGTAYSNKKGAHPSAIICEVRPHDDQGIRLAIITTKRTLKFKSRYTVIETDTDS